MFSEVVSSFYGSFLPLEWYLKLNGFVPIFWSECTVWWKKVINWIFLVLNFAVCTITSYLATEFSQQSNSGLQNEIQDSSIMKFLMFCEPAASMIIGFSMAKKIQQVFRELCIVDLKASKPSCIKNSPSNDFLSISAANDRSRQPKPPFCA